MQATGQQPPGFEEMGFEVVANNGSQFTDFLAQEIARWKTVIETGNIKPE